MLGLLLDDKSRLGTRPSPPSHGCPVNVKLSVVVPIFNEEENIRFLHKELSSVLSKITENYEIVAVDDGSSDPSLALLRLLSQEDPRLKIVSFSRNFGHQIAITAGIEFAKGEAIVIIDADLQDPPELIIEMMKKWTEGYDVVYAVRKERKGESFLKLLTAKIFYRLLALVSRVRIPLDAGDFRLLSRRAAQAILSMPEQRRYVRGMVSWLGFRQCGIPYERDERKYGETHYPVRKMLRFALDGITSFSYVPLHLASYLGFASAGLSFILIIYTLWVRFFNQAAIRGWASSVIITLFIGGIQLIMIGGLGEYIARALDEMRRRPLYIVQETINCQ